MSDIGDIVLKERPLIIREAIAGGRKLTKALYMQMPVLKGMPFAGTGISVIAWLNLHWKGCGDGRYNWGSLGYDHRHILAEENGTPKRGTVWQGLGFNAPVEIGANYTLGGKELGALLARKKLEGKGLEGTVMSGEYRVKARHNAVNITFSSLVGYNTIGDVLNNYLSTAQVAAGEPPKQLVALALPAVAEAELIASVEKAIAEEMEWRNDLAQLWDLVTKETPQVYI